MTRRIPANLYMTLDGRGEFPSYPASELVPPEPDEAFLDQRVRRYDDVANVICGRRSFEAHLAVHSEAARRSNDPEVLFRYSRWLDRANKVGLSRTLRSTSWSNRVVLAGDLGELVTRLREGPGKNIIVDGGPALVREFMIRDLADDYPMTILPVVHARGPAYWTEMPTQRPLHLLSVRSLPYGELLLHYEAVR